MATPLVSVGLVTWNSARTLAPCLRSLARQTDLPLELIVVDNASSDESLDVVAKEYPLATVVRNTKNCGFCGGHNQAIRLAKGKYYLPLNPDIILQSDYVLALMTAIENEPDAGMAAAKLYLGSPQDSNRRIDSTGLFIDRQRRQYLRGFGEPERGNYERVEEVFGVDGAAPLYRRDMLEDIQVDGEYFDEAFFAHKEDVDLAWRARLLGWRCIYTPHAVAYHGRSFRPGKRKKMSAEVRFHAVKNRYLLLLKNESLAGWKRDWLPILWYDIKIIGYLLLVERSSLGALFALRRYWQRGQKWRKQIWDRVRVDPCQLLQWFR